MRQPISSRDRSRLRVPLRARFRPRRRSSPRAPTTVVTYDIAVTLDAEKKEITGRERIVWRNPSTDPADAVSDLWFHLYWNAFRNNRSTFHVESGGRLRDDEAETDGWGWTEVTAMKLATGEDLLPSLTFEHPDDDNADDRTVARVLLPEAVPPGGEVTIDIEFHARLPKVFARAGYKGDFFAVTQWFPKLGVFEPAGMRGREKSGWNCHQYHANTEYYADYGRFKVEITVPKRFVVGATGPEIARRENPDGTMTYVHEQADVHDFAWTADPRFLEFRERFSADRDVTPAEYAAAAKLLDRTSTRSSSGTSRSGSSCSPGTSRRSPATSRRQSSPSSGTASGTAPIPTRP